MATIIRQLHETLDAGAAGCSTQYLVPESRLSVQWDYKGTPMITDIMPDEVASHVELEAIVKGYSKMAGFDQTQVNR